MTHTLQLILLLLAASVVAVVLCRLVRLPPILGYLAIGIAVGPHALGWVPDDANVRDLAEFGVVFLMFSIGLEFSLPQLKTMRRAVFGLGLAQVAITTLVAMVGLHFLQLQLACRIRARRRAGDELDRHRVETARRALRAQLAARARRDGHPAVPGPGRGRVPDRGADAGRGRRGSVEAAGHRRRQGRRRARRDPVLRPEADARLVLHRCPAALAGAVHAQRAAGDARAGGADRARRAVVRAGRFSRGHADRGNRVPLPGRRRHQAVSRRPARPVLRQRGHVSESDHRRATISAGCCCC